MGLDRRSLLSFVFLLQAACGGPKVGADLYSIRAERGSESSLSLAVPESMIDGEPTCDDRVAALAPGGSPMLSLAWEGGEVLRRVTVRFDRDGQPASYTDVRGALGNIRTRGQPIPGTSIMLDWAQQVALVENQGPDGTGSAVRLDFQEALRSEALGRPSEVVETIRELCSVGRSDFP